MVAHTEQFLAKQQEKRAAALLLKNAKKFEAKLLEALRVVVRTPN